MEALPFYCLGVQAILELVLLSSVKSKLGQKISAGLLLFLLSFGCGLLLFNFFGLPSVVFVFCSLFRALNLMRFAEGRMSPDYLRISVFRSSWRLIIVQTLAVFIAWSLVEYSFVLTILSILLLVFSAVVFLQTAGRLARIDLAVIPKPQATKELPVVSVVIPARNETEDLSECIRTVLESDYPKLEILVYDDCSQDKTPQIIKEYAHSGVRFIQGEEPAAGWLAKNAAYQKLYKEALGELVLFCGVDLRFEPTAISSLVEIMRSKKLDMVNILPRRDVGMRYALFFQSARYLWELALPRRLVKRPPALSSCWVAKKTLLGKKGFEPVSRSAMPERYFAWKAEKSGAYKFLSARNLGLVYSRKSAEEQHSTAVRLRYPQLRKRPENVLVYVLSALFAIALPAVVFVLVLLGNLPFYYLFFAASIVVLLNMTNGLITDVVSPSHRVISVCIFPLVVLLDLAVLVVSMSRYEFGKIEWKGRNVCVPIMHVEPKLPKL